MIEKEKKFIWFFLVYIFCAPSFSAVHEVPGSPPLNTAPFMHLRSFSHWVVDVIPIKVGPTKDPSSYQTVLSLIEPGFLQGSHSFASNRETWLQKHSFLTLLDVPEIQALHIDQKTPFVFKTSADYTKINIVFFPKASEIPPKSNLITLLEFSKYFPEKPIGFGQVPVTLRGGIQMCFEKDFQQLFINAILSAYAPLSPPQKSARGSSRHFPFSASPSTTFVPLQQTKWDPRVESAPSWLAQSAWAPSPVAHAWIPQPASSSLAHAFTSPAGHHLLSQSSPPKQSALNAAFIPSWVPDDEENISLLPPCLTPDNLLLANSKQTYSVDWVPVVYEGGELKIVLRKHQDGYLTSLRNIIAGDLSLSEILDILNPGPNSFYAWTYTQPQTPTERGRANVLLVDILQTDTLPKDDTRLKISEFLENITVDRLGLREGLKRPIRDREGLFQKHVQDVKQFLKKISSSPHQSRDPLEFIHDLARSRSIPTSFSAREKDLAQEVAKTPLQLSARKDLTALPWVTIDGPDSRDFDDAVQAELDPSKGQGVYKITVAIADVAEYVKPGSLLDEAAKQRGTSIYFQGGVLPMLPEALSNGSCSLNPNENRYCLAAEIWINGDGHIVEKNFSEAIMKSHARLTYEQAQKIHEKKLDHSNSSIKESLDHLFAVHEILKEEAKKRGALDFNTSESDKDNPKFDSYGMIEKIMVLTNKAVAEYLQENGYPCVYRLHDCPSMKKTQELAAALKIHIPNESSQAFSDFVTTLSSEQKNIVLCIMPKAYYSLSPSQGHFGLSLSCYSHFTSPIRRYPDLLTHRSLKALLRKEAKNRLLITQQDAKMCSQKEIRATQFERLVQSINLAQNLQSEIGTIFNGSVVKISEAGLILKLESFPGGTVFLPKEGLKLNYPLGAPIHVKLMEANRETGWLKFNVV